jgi:hypothetical protein
MVVLNMKNVGKLVDIGDYPVTLTSVSEKKTAKGDDMVTFGATIKDSDTDWDGRQLFRNFVFPTKTDPTRDMSGTLFFLQKTLLAFGADEDDVTDEQMDPVKIGKPLYGNKAKATVTHNVDENDPEKVYANVSFSELDF